MPRTKYVTIGFNTTKQINIWLGFQPTKVTLMSIYLADVNEGPVSIVSDLWGNDQMGLVHTVESNLGSDALNINAPPCEYFLARYIDGSNWTFSALTTSTSNFYTTGTVTLLLKFEE